MLYVKGYSTETQSEMTFVRWHVKLSQCPTKLSFKDFYHLIHLIYDTRYDM